MSSVASLGLHEEELVTGRLVGLSGGSQEGMQIDGTRLRQAPRPRHLLSAGGVAARSGGTRV